jgi:hypothetical protein
MQDWKAGPLCATTFARACGLGPAPVPPGASVARARVGTAVGPRPPCADRRRASATPGRREARAWGRRAGTGAGAGLGEAGARASRAGAGAAGRGVFPRSRSLRPRTPFAEKTGSLTDGAGRRIHLRDLERKDPKAGQRVQARHRHREQEQHRKATFQPGCGARARRPRGLRRRVAPGGSSGSPMPPRCFGWWWSSSGRGRWPAREGRPSARGRRRASSPPRGRPSAGRRSGRGR